MTTLPERRGLALYNSWQRSAHKEFKNKLVNSPTQVQARENIKSENRAKFVINQNKK